MWKNTLFGLATAGTWFFWLVLTSANWLMWLLSWLLFGIWLLLRFAWKRRYAYWSWQRKYWWPTLVVLVIGGAMLSKEVHFSMGTTDPFFKRPSMANLTGDGFLPKLWATRSTTSFEELPPVNTSQLTRYQPGGVEDANTFSNLGFKEKKGESASSRAARLAKRKKRVAYVRQYADAARREMEKYGIPASITLSQGLLESNVGESPLARKNNNHFGIKCFSRRCEKGHCSNFNDDHHKDFFRIYGSVWESFRAHSILLQKDRYQGLYKLKRTDYKGWAHGLKKAGYATDPRYAYKIIGLIEDLELHKYDR